MSTLIAMMGLPRSGKSTFVKGLSKDLAAPIVRKDDIRLSLHGQAYVGLAEPMVRAISLIMVRSLFLSGHSVVIADETHYSRAARDFMRGDGKEWQTYFYHLNTSPEVCKERAIATNQAYLLPVIDEMVKRYEPLGEDELIYTLPPPRRWFTPFEYEHMRDLGSTP